MPQLTPVVKGLLVANIGIFILDFLILPLALGIRVNDFKRPPIFEFGAFSIQSALMGWRLWEFVTFQFIHATVGHVLFNCI